IWAYIDENKEWMFSGVGNILVFTIFGSIVFFVVKKSYVFIKNRINMKKIKKGTFDDILSFTKKDRSGKFINSELSKVLNIKKLIKENYSEYNDFLIIQYGSSLKHQSQPANDYDFIVLLLGHPTTERKEIRSVGDNPEYQLEKKIKVDIVFRDYKSFLFAACSGMPYENSVIFNSKLVHGHIGYYEWLKRITKNILMDKDFLIRRYNDKLLLEKEVYEKAKNYGEFYDLVRAGYFYVTSLLQDIHLKKMQKILAQKDVITLANINDIGEIINDEKQKEVYIRLIRYLKRLEIATSKEILSRDLERLIEYIFENLYT
ncbi:hypothetical protein, partial [Neobacillus drentensis]|uniref:hypothetical protein n=1 Tax=Neobacillus drentensis TaxID=220684 RepID=UPI002FFEB5AF